MLSKARSKHQTGSNVWSPIPTVQSASSGSTWHCCSVKPRPWMGLVFLMVYVSMLFYVYPNKHLYSRKTYEKMAIFIGMVLECKVAKLLKSEQSQSASYRRRLSLATFRVQSGLPAEGAGTQCGPRVVLCATRRGGRKETHLNSVACWCPADSSTFGGICGGVNPSKPS